jgi:hypothetical protein
MTDTQVLERTHAHSSTPSAVVWIDRLRAIVVATNGDSDVSTCEVDRGSLPETLYLAQVVRVIGDRQRVVIMGPGSLRLAVEREYVDLFHRPDRLIDVEPAGLMTTEELVERVRMLAA